MAAHFSEDAIHFLRGLERHNNREWFGERKSVYETALKAPMLAVIGAVNDRLVSFAPEYVKPPTKVMLRFYRDTRFSADKRPYKTRVSAWWGRSGMHKTSGAGFYFDLSAAQLTIAAGLFMPEREQLLQIRRFLLNRGESVRTALEGKGLKRLGMVRVEGQTLSRTPKGFAPGHPADDLLRCRRWGVSATLPYQHAMAPGLSREIDRRFRAAASLVYLLNEPFAPREKRSIVAPLAF